MSTNGANDSVRMQPAAWNAVLSMISDFQSVLRKHPEAVSNNTVDILYEVAEYPHFMLTPKNEKDNGIVHTSIVALYSTIASHFNTFSDHVDMSTVYLRYRKVIELMSLDPISDDEFVNHVVVKGNDHDTPVSLIVRELFLSADFSAFHLGEENVDMEVLKSTVLGCEHFIKNLVTARYSWEDQVHSHRMGEFLTALLHSGEVKHDDVLFISRYVYLLEFTGDVFIALSGSKGKAKGGTGKSTTNRTKSGRGTVMTSENKKSFVLAMETLLFADAESSIQHWVPEDIDELVSVVTASNDLTASLVLKLMQPDENDLGGGKWSQRVERPFPLVTPQWHKW